MVRKMVRTAAATLAVASMFTMSAFAAEWNTQGGSAEVEGEGTYVEPVIEVELPGDLAFGINPLQLDADEDGTADAQIISGTYPVINRGNVRVAITAETVATPGGNVDVLTDAAYDTVSKDLAAVAGKQAVWLVQLYPTAVTVDAEGAVGLTVTDVADEDQNADIAGQVVSKDDTAPTKVKFMLEPYKETSGKMEATCASGFKFSGAVDPNAAFAEGDTLTVKTKYTLTTVSENQKTTKYEPFKATNATVNFDASVVKDKGTTTP